METNTRVGTYTCLACVLVGSTYSYLHTYLLFVRGEEKDVGAMVTTLTAIVDSVNVTGGLW